MDEDEDADELFVKASDLLDRTCGRPRVLAEKCATCIFRPGNLMHLRPGAVKDMVDQVREVGTFIPCHDTLPGTPVQPAVCRGWYDAHGAESTSLQFLTRAFGEPVEIDPPEK